MNYKKYLNNSEYQHDENFWQKPKPKIKSKKKVIQEGQTISPSGSSMNEAYPINNSETNNKRDDKKVSDIYESNLPVWSKRKKDDPYFS